MIVEGVPARTLGAFAVAREIGLAHAFIDEVVFARHVMHIERGLTDELACIVELVGLGEVSDVAGMDHEGGLGRHGFDLGDGLAQRAERIRVGRLVEADMAVADLEEGEGGRFRGERIAEQAE